MKNRFPRDFYVPKGALKVADKASTAVAFTYEANGQVYAVGFQGKADKPAFRYRYRDAARREKALAEFFQGVQQAEAARAQRAATRKAFVHSYQAGDVFKTCWGYEQTNVEFFELVEVKGKHVMLREIACEYKAHGDMQGNKVPMVGQYVGEPIRRLAQEGRIKIDDVRTAWPHTFKKVAGIKVYDAAHTSSYH